MEYESFERDFIVRILKVIEEYEKHVPKDEQFEVTLLINCLLGLLVLPKERFYEKIPGIPINSLEGWGIRAEDIEPHDSPTLRRLSIALIKRGKD